MATGTFDAARPAAETFAADASGVKADTVVSQQLCRQVVGIAEKSEQ
ncbi:MAG: hypothetical protein ACRDMV_04000 [Streptosporangiales bacterium]